MRMQHFTHFNEYPHDPDVDFYSSICIQDTGQHEDPMFGKGKWGMSHPHNFRIGGRKLRPPFFEFFFIQLKHEVSREPVPVSTDLLFKAFSFNTIKTGEVLVQHNFCPSHNVNVVE